MSQKIDTTVQSDIVEIRIPARAEWVAVARLAVAAVAHRMPFSLEEIEDLKLAIAEACTTAIQYAHNGETIEISCDVREDELRLLVRHRHLPTTRQVSENEPGTEELGLVLIQALMDDVSYVVDQADGSKLEMIKRLQS